MSSSFYQVFYSIFESRKKRNAAYSLRAFARDCKIPVSRISQYFSGQRSIKTKSAQSILDQIAATSEEKNKLEKAFRESFVELEKCYSLKEEALNRVQSLNYFAFMSLFEIYPEFSYDLRWEEKLGINTEMLEQIIRDFHYLNIIEYNGTAWVPVYKSLATTTDIPSERIRGIHKEVFHKNAAAIDVIPIDRREVQSFVLAADARRIKIAKKMIVNFSTKLCRYLEGGKKNELFVFSVQLMPWLKHSEGERK